MIAVDDEAPETRRVARSLARVALSTFASALGLCTMVCADADASAAEAAAPGGAEPGCGVTHDGVASCPFPGPPPAAEEALATLEEGNRRFVNGTMRHPHSGAELRAALGRGQRPIATVIGCSDSRVPPEMIFDGGLGDLFVVRVAGNVQDTDVTASVQYAVEHLQTPLLMVMGHEHCGAVTAAVQHVRGELADRDQPPEILSLLQRIEPGLPAVAHDHDVPLDAAVHGAVEDNVRHTIGALSAVPSIARAVADGRLVVVGAIYDLDSGAVRYLEPTGEGT